MPAAAGKRETRTFDHTKSWLPRRGLTRPRGVRYTTSGRPRADHARNWTDTWTTVLIGRDTENERVNRSRS
jgi:hypothetical protein